jgi:Flp pilus assembly protein protease CpaA
VAFAIMAIAVFFDLRWREIPDALSVVLLALALIATGFHLHRIPWLDLCLGLLLGFAAGLLLFRVGALGGGDVKLLSSLGAVLGLQAELGVLFYTAVIGAALAVVALFRRQREYPYVPAIALGLLTFILRWYWA